MNGFDVQSRLAVDNGDKIAVVVITAHDTPASQERALAGGASAYLRKPVDARTLLDAVGTAIGRPSGGARGDGCGVERNL
jgi:CheY-like chemotaxis protein